MEDPDIIDYLVSKQRQLRMNDAAFCRFLGLSDLSTWLRYKARERTGDRLRLVQLAADKWPTEHGTIWQAALHSRVRGGPQLATT